MTKLYQPLFIFTKYRGVLWGQKDKVPSRVHCFPDFYFKKILRIWLHAQLYPHLGWSDPHFGWLDPYSKSFWMSLAPIFNTFWQIRFGRYGNSHRSLTNLALIPNWKRLAKNSYIVGKKHRPNGFTFQISFKQEGQNPVGSDAIGVLLLVVPRWENLFECVAVWHLCRTWLRDWISETWRPKRAWRLVFFHEETNMFHV